MFFFILLKFSRVNFPYLTTERTESDSEGPSYCVPRCSVAICEAIRCEDRKRYARRGEGEVEGIGRRFYPSRRKHNRRKVSTRCFATSDNILAIQLEQTLAEKAASRQVHFLRFSTPISPFPTAPPPPPPTITSFPFLTR